MDSCFKMCHLSVSHFFSKENYFGLFFYIFIFCSFGVVVSRITAIGRPPLGALDMGEQRFPILAASGQWKGSAQEINNRICRLRCTQR